VTPSEFREDVCCW